MDFESRVYEYPLPMRYHLKPPGKPGLVVAMHGFQDNASSMMKRLGWTDADLPFRLMAVNGPFPVPVWSGSQFREAYAWYFRDTSRDLTLVPPQLMASRLAGLLKELGLEDTPKVLLGFSQGGYLAPHVALKTRNVRAIVGIGCGFMMDAYDQLQPLTVHALHGELDKVIDLERARADHGELLRRGFKGEFHVEPGLDHRVDQVLEARVRRLCEAAL